MGGDQPDIDVVIDRLWFLLTRVRVLVVLDGTTRTASFGAGDPLDVYFGLSEFVQTITSGTGFTRVELTKAHRDTDPRGAADIDHFRFDAHDLSQYDEILLFGVAAAGETGAPMSDSELAALATFMDAGGGVFATGDHEDLGVELCGRVPRVRSMRKWYHPNPGPLGEPVAPPAIGEDRIDTTQLPVGGVVSFDNQSDDVPQPLELRWYTGQAAPLWQWTYPHPLMCGPRGALRVAPDHMHEGEVIVPWDPDAILTFAGKSFTEYPAGTAGPRPLPEIVAWGRTLAETNLTVPYHLSDPNHVADARSFGVVGAYDGHRAGVGRVAVDSTWHHFFDINLIGDPVASYPKSLGFKVSTSGIQALEDIRSYFRNLVTWLAPPGALSRLFAGAAWWALVNQPLAMLVNPRNDYAHGDIMSIGAYALRTVLLRTPPCSVIVSLLPYLVDGPAKVIPPDPWAGPGPVEAPLLDPTLYLRASLGGAVVALAAEREKLSALDGEEATDAAVRVVNQGIAHGIRGLGGELGQLAKGLGRLAEDLRSAGG